MKKKKITVAVISAVSVLAIILCFAPSFAKYITTQGRQSKLDSDHFYFSSDYLSEGVLPEYKIYGDSVAFEIRNFIDSFRVNDSDIAYTVSATDGTLTKDGTPTSGGTINGGTKAADTVTLTYSGEEAEKEITVTVKSSSPYVKELKAKFIFAESVMRYEITDSAGSYYAELYIYTGDTAQTVTVNWDKAKLLIDETNDFVFGKLNADKNAASVSIPAHTTVKIAFFKNDITKNYSYALTKFDGTINMPTSSGS